MDQSSSGVLSPAVWNRLASDMECLLRTKYSAPFFVTETAGVSRTVSILLPENIAWGTLTTAWTSGLTVTLQPCASISDSTSTGAPTVDVYLQYPYGRVPQWCGYAVGDIVPYMIYDTGEKVALENPLADIAWGTLTAAWTAGIETVTLQPCASISDSTSTGAPTVAVFLQYPYGSVPQWCGYAVGDIVPYRIFTTGQKIALSNPLPRISKKYQSWYNNGGTGDGDPVSVVADFLRAISASDV